MEEASCVLLCLHKSHTVHSQLCYGKHVDMFSGQDTVHYEVKKRCNGPVRYMSKYLHCVRFSSTDFHMATKHENAYQSTTQVLYI